MVDDETDKILRRFEHLEPVPDEDEDFARTTPVAKPADLTTCSRCKRSYDERQFLALPPASNGGTWTFEFAVFAIRQCSSPGCNNSLGRRIR